ncbi:RabGAP/TBC [Basidiobolus meristosporus CBS 931.73]|uniref:RabGAP/TBC n=1 Tax=Basidiobolus meristosporus CBS 931.73 TaxID=1314790 RepID=A0A1Y1YJ87_9FUNG|nr:RabGAP/TBC [Basidiobolus meristosporus CBS 931.73]|eukprot:ORX98101.1 RabGAP/TBC [Basidiobolus meristosporus CBS 931.73]
MKSYDIIRAKWKATFDPPSISLETFKDRGMFGTSCTEGLRSVCWKIYLDCLPSLDTSSWVLALQQQRQYYEDLKKRFVFDPNAEETAQEAQNLAVNNPLSLDQESPWIQYFKDGELRKIIRQDVERTFPDYEYFHSTTAQTRLTDMLFIYCKLHEDVSYRQGMHELLAPILQIVDDECLEVSSLPEEDNELPSELIKEVLNPEYVEHDTFSLFTNLMKSAKQWYEFNDELSNQRTLRALKTMGKSLDESNLLGSQTLPMTPNQTPIMVKCTRIHHELLKVYDPQLYAYLESLQIEPQLYGIRWLRLLFGREFPLEELPRLWDGIFADGADLGLVDYICVAMLLYIREDLLAADYAMCLHRIMKFPSVADLTIFIKQALHLRDHPNFDGGSKIIFQNARNAGRQAPTLFNYPNEEPAKPGNQRARRTQSDTTGNITAAKPHTGRVHPPRKRDEAIAQINKAMHDIKKTVNPLQSYLKRTLSYNQKVQHDSSSNEPDFQSIYEHAIPQSVPASEDPIPGKSKSQVGASVEALDSPVTFEIGSLVDKCIDLLEKGIFGKSLSSAAESSAESTPAKSSEIVKNEMDIVTALVGLKHVRDVLTRVTADLNPDILSQPWPQEGDDHWELVEHHSDSDAPPAHQDISTLGVIVEASPEFSASEVDKDQPESPVDTKSANPTTPKESAFVDLSSNDWKSSNMASPEPEALQDPWKSEPESYLQTSPVVECAPDGLSDKSTEVENYVTGDSPTEPPSHTAPPKRVTQKADVLSSLESILAEDERSPSTPSRFSTNPNYNWIFHGNKDSSSNFDSCASMSFSRSESAENLKEYTSGRMSQSLDLEKERKPKNLPTRTKKLVGKSVSNDSDDPLKSRDVNRRNLRILDDYA